MDLEVGSNLYQNTDGTIEIEGGEGVRLHALSMHPGRNRAYDRRHKDT